MPEPPPIPLCRDERLAPFRAGWIIVHEHGMPPCPWAFDLARFARPRAGARVLDLGCGSGSLLLALHQRRGGLRGAVGVDLDPLALGQAARVAAAAELPSAWVRADVRALPVEAGTFDLVVANPPFYPAGWGRVSAEPRVAAATHELNGTVADFAHAAAGALADRAEAVFLFDADRLKDLLLALDGAALRAHRARFLVDDRGRPSRVLVAARRGRGGLRLE